MANGDRGFVAITGANGTIGYACAVYALNAGYRVRCIVRRDDAIEAIKSGPSVQQHLSRMEFATVPDNTTDGAYEKAFDNVDYIIHIAGAWPLPHLHPDNDIYIPFMQSMKNVLQAAENSGTVKRVVFTQAGAGLVNSEDGDTLGTRMEQVLDEHVKVNEVSRNFTPPLKSSHNAYCASKAQCMAYLNALRLSNTTPFSIVQVIPGTVIGPSEFVKTKTQARAYIDRQTKALLFDDMKPRYAFGFVHVQDCARVHVEALDEERAKRENVPPWFVAAGTVEPGIDGSTLWNQAADVIERRFAEQVSAGLFKVGREKVPTNMPFRVESKLTEQTLLDGQRIRGLVESVTEVTEWYLGLEDN